MADRDDSFFARWSRRKSDARAAVPAAPGPEAGTPSGTATAASVAPGGAAGSTEPGSVAAPATQARDAAIATPRAERGEATTTPSADSPTTSPPPPTLADVAALSRDADYSRFVARDVAPEVKNAALRKLFSDPHFNVMDGLDIYIDDYGKPDPLPPGMLRKMVQSQLLGLFAPKPPQAGDAAPPTAPLDAADAIPDATPDAAGTPQAPAPGRAADARACDARDTPVATATDAAADAAVASKRDATEPNATSPSAAPAPADATNHEDPDLQLQPDDAAGRPGAGPGSGPDAGREP